MKIVRGKCGWLPILCITGKWVYSWIGCYPQQPIKAKKQGAFHVATQGC